MQQIKDKGSCLVKSTVDEIYGVKNDEYSNINEINMDDFCLIAGSNKRRKPKSSKVFDSFRRERQAI